MRGLRLRKYRVRNGRFLAEGIRVVEDLLLSSVRPCWALTASSIEDSERGRELVREIDSRGIPRRTLTDREFAGYAATEAPQGIIVVADIPRANLRASVSVGGSAVVLLLDAVQDPGNLGTMVRCAEAFGATAVVLLAGTVDPWNPKAVRSAAGSTFRVPVAQADWTEASGLLKREGYVLLGATAEGDPLGPGRPTRVALVVGNEGSGLSSEVAGGVDRLVGIPLPGRAESLNVTAAAAILLYELTR